MTQTKVIQSASIYWKWFIYSKCYHNSSDYSIMLSSVCDTVIAFYVSVVLPWFFRIPSCGWYSENSLLLDLRSIMCFLTCRKVLGFSLLWPPCTATLGCIGKDALLLSSTICPEVIEKINLFLFIIWGLKAILKYLDTEELNMAQRNLVSAKFAHQIYFVMIIILCCA